MRFGIDKKIITLVTLAIVLLGVSFSYYFISQEKKALLLELDERANTLLKSMITSCEYPVLINDLDSLSKIANGTMQQKDLVSCDIENKYGKELFKAGDMKSVDSRIYTGSILTEKQKTGGGEDLILGTGPQEKETESIGSIRIALSLVSLDNPFSCSISRAVVDLPKILTTTCGHNNGLCLNHCQFAVF